MPPPEPNGRVAMLHADMTEMRKEMQAGLNRIELLLTARLNEHSLRIRKLESRWAWWLGAAAAVAAVVSMGYQTLALMR